MSNCNTNIDFQVINLLVFQALEAFSFSVKIYSRSVVSNIGNRNLIFSPREIANTKIEFALIILMRSNRETIASRFECGKKLIPLQIAAV